MNNLAFALGFMCVVPLFRANTARLAEEYVNVAQRLRDTAIAEFGWLSSYNGRLNETQQSGNVQLF